MHLRTWPKRKGLIKHVLEGQAPVIYFFLIEQIMQCLMVQISATSSGLKVKAVVFRFKNLFFNLFSFLNT